jgi:hypothetical protein
VCHCPTTAGRRGGCAGRALDGPYHDLWIIAVTGGWWLLLPAPGGERECGDMGCGGLSPGAGVVVELGEQQSLSSWVCHDCLLTPIGPGSGLMKFARKP